MAEWILFGLNFKTSQQYLQKNNELQVYFSMMAKLKTSPDSWVHIGSVCERRY